LKQKNAALDQQRQGLLDAARADAKTERQRLLDEAGQAADSQRSTRLSALQSELQKLQKDIALRSRTEVLAIANKVLGDLADTSVDQRMVEVLLRRLQGLGPQDKAALTQALKTDSNTVMVRSACELSQDQRVVIQRALQSDVAPGLQVRFEADPALISGVEISSDGWKLAWNIADYLATLEQQTVPVAATGPRP
jgi:F-type H+-transporting ATPase subunit b